MDPQAFETAVAVVMAGQVTGIATMIVVLLGVRVVRDCVVTLSDQVREHRTRRRLAALRATRLAASPALS